MNESIIIYVLFVHWLADFVFQSDKMAHNKSDSLYWLSIHVMVYTLILVIMINPVYGIINGVSHFIIDYFTSKLNKKLWGLNQTHYFFVSVGFDQFLHIVWLILTLKYL